MAYQPKSYRKYLAGAVTTAVVASSFAGVAGAASYDDVNSKYQDAVDFVVSKGIKGIDANSFGTYENIKRVDAAVFVAQILGLNTTSAPAAGFTDVPDRAKGAVNALKAAGITSGKSATEFGAYDYITRGELAIWLTKGFELEASHQALAFSDVSDKYAGAVNALVSNKVTNGTSATTFGTYDNAKRGDFATFLKRAHDAKNGSGKDDDRTPVGLSIQGDSQGEKLANGKSKLYTVKLVNPVSGKPVEGAVLNVTFEENVGTGFGPERNATVTNAENHAVTPYQANDGQEREVEIVTDKNGVATFEVTGSNTSVTPIVFLDGSYQEWDTKGGKLPDTQDDRFDKNTELYAKAKTLTFGVTEYKITVEGQRTNYAAVAQELRRGGVQNNGREYIITVKKPDGSAYAGGRVNVGIYQLLDGKLGNEPTAAYLYRIIKTTTGDDEVALEDSKLNDTQGTIKLDANGQAKVWVASEAVNDNAEPIVWVDQNDGANPQGLNTYEAGEPVSDHTKVEPTNFQPVRIDNGALGAKLKVESNYVDGFQDFKLELLNQSGKAFQPERALEANVTFTIENTGTHDVLIDTDHIRDQHITNTRDVDLTSSEHITVHVGGSLTVSGHIDDVNEALFSAFAVDGTSTLKVKASAVIDDDVLFESGSVTVTADYVETTIGYSYEADVTATKVNSDSIGDADTVVLEFTSEVSGQEAGDFRVGGIKATSVTKEGKKLIIKFPESVDFNAATEINYDPNGAGGSVLIDQFGNKVEADTWTF